MIIIIIIRTFYKMFQGDRYIGSTKATLGFEVVRLETGNGF